MVDSPITALIDGRLAVLATHGLGPGVLCEHFDRLRATAPLEADELETMARAIDRPPATLLALDGGLVEVLTGAGIERSLGLHVEGEAGSILAGSWALPATEAEHVALRESAHGWSFGLPGSLGFAGIARAGHVVVTNVMRPATAGSGIVGSAVLGRILAAQSLLAARAVLDSTALVGGRNWMLADGVAFLGIEQLGDVRLLTRVGHKAGHVHANHCFDPSMRQREAVPRSPASFRRLELASTIYVQRRPTTLAAVLDYFDEVEEAAFADAGQRAGTSLAVEPASGRAIWRARTGGSVETLRFTPKSPVTSDQ